MDRQKNRCGNGCATIEDFRARAVNPHRLGDVLQVLHVETDPHHSQVRDDFEEYWSALEIELAQRTEPWRPGVATDQSLQVAVGWFEWWVRKVLDESLLDEHG